MSVRKKLMSVVAAVATAAAMGATGVAANAADVVAVPQEGLSDTGASIAIVVVLVVVLAAIGVGVTVARKRQSATGAHVQGEDEGAAESGLVADGADTADTQTVQFDDAAPTAARRPTPARPNSRASTRSTPSRRTPSTATAV